MSKSLNSIFKAAALIAVLTIVARIAGFIRYLVFGASVGAGEIGTAYVSANLLPNLLFEVAAGGALAALVIPLIAGIPQNSKPSAVGSNQIASVILNYALVTCSLLGLLVFIFAPQLASYIFGLGDSVNPETKQLAAYFLQIFAVQLPFYAVAIVLGAYLQSLKKFLWPAVAPLSSSLVVMLSYFIYALATPAVITAGTLGTSAKHILAWGTTLAVVAMALTVAIPANRHGYRWYFTWKLPKTLAKQAGALGIAGFTSVLAQQLVLALILLFAARSGGIGTLPLFQYGQAVYLLPFAVLVMPLITSTLPYLSELRLVGQQQKFSHLARSSSQSVLLLAAIGTSALWGAAVGIDRFFAIIDRNSILGVGAVTAALALGLIGYALIFHTSRLLSAALRAKEALVLGSVPWVAAGILILVGNLGAPIRTPQDAAALFGLSVAAGMGIGLLTALTLLNERLLTQTDMAQLLRTLAISLTATTLSSIGGYLLSVLLSGLMRNLLGAFAVGAITGILAASLCAGLLYLFDRKQATALLRKFRQQINKRSSAAATGLAAVNKAQQND